MSMKRTRTKSFGSSKRYDDGPVSFNRSSHQPEKSWDEHIAGQPDDAFVGYSTKAKFELGALISHPKFGKGVVIGVEDQRIDVLFQDAKRKLAHGLA
jgi:hypothetical protein